MKTESKILTISVFTAAILFILGVVNFFIWKKDDFAPQLVGALFSTVATGVITVLLLKTQTSAEEEHEVRGKIFDKKTEAYQKLMDSLENILQDGKINTIKDYGIDNSQKDELQQILFEITLLSSFVGNNVVKESFGKNKPLLKTQSKMVDSNIDDDKNKSFGRNETDEQNQISDGSINDLINSVLLMINNANDNNTKAWDLISEKDSKERQKQYYTKLIRGLVGMNRFAQKNIQTEGNPNLCLNLNKLINDSQLFKINQEDYIVNTEISKQSNSEQKKDYRINEVKKMLQAIKDLLGEYSYDKKELRRSGEAGDDWWGYWCLGNKEEWLNEETIAAWMLEKNRRKTFGYEIKISDGLSMRLEIWGGGYCVTQYFVADTDDMKNKVASNMEDIKTKFAEGWGTWWNVQDYGIFLSRDLKFDSFNFHDEYNDDYGKKIIAQIEKLNHEWKDDIKKSIEVVKEQLC